MTTLAVLLIIGSAVVGPIEAKQFPGSGEYLFADGSMAEWAMSSYGPRPEDAKHLCVKMGAAHNLKEAKDCTYVWYKDARYESLPELCERAMKEAGATRDVRGHWWLFETIGTAKPRPNDYNTGYIEVRCIPVPTGYKR